MPGKAAFGTTITGPGGAIANVTTISGGGITLDTVAGVAATGVDLISVGDLTHSVRALDVSLDITLSMGGKR